MQTITQTRHRTAAIFNSKIKHILPINQCYLHRNDKRSCVSEQFDLEEAYIKQKEKDPKRNPVEHHKRFEQKMIKISLHQQTKFSPWGKRQTTPAQAPETQLYVWVFVKVFHDLLCQMLHLNQVIKIQQKTEWGNVGILGVFFFLSGV